MQRNKIWATRFLSDRRGSLIIWPPAPFRTFESLWVILNKICAYNHVTLANVIRQFRNPRANYRRSARTGLIRSNVPDLRFAREIDLPELAAAMRTPLGFFAASTVDQLWPEESPTKHWISWSHLCYCPVCLAEGSHSTLFQFRGVTLCPEHDVPICRACPACKEAIPYGLPRIVHYKINCPNCSAELGRLTAPSSEAVSRSSRLIDAAAGVSIVAHEHSREAGWIFSPSFRLPSIRPDGLALSQHRRNLFRYVCETFSELLTAPLRASMRSAIPHGLVWRVSPFEPDARPSEALPPEPEKHLQHRLAEQYLRLMRRWRRRLKVGRRLITLLDASRAPSELAEDWAYWLIRAFWENSAVGSLVEELPHPNKSPALFARLGEKLQVVGSRTIDFIPSNSTIGFFDALWANLHVWTSFFGVFRNAALQWLKAGIPEAEIFARLHAIDSDRCPMFILRCKRQTRHRIELHSWPVVEDAERGLVQRQ